MAKTSAATKSEISKHIAEHANSLANYLAEHALATLGPEGWYFRGVLGKPLTEEQYDEACQKILLAVAEKWIASHKRNGKI